MAFRWALRLELERLAEQYHGAVSERRHFANIETLAKTLSDKYPKTLSGKRFRIGSAQKALSKVYVVFGIHSHSTPLSVRRQSSFESAQLSRCEMDPTRFWKRIRKHCPMCQDSSRWYSSRQVGIEPIQCHGTSSNHRRLIVLFKTRCLARFLHEIAEAEYARELVTEGILELSCIDPKFVLMFAFVRRRPLWRR